MTFTRRPLSGPETLGERLRQLREERRLTTDELGRAIEVAGKYIEAIEQGQYALLPGLVYARNFVRQYAAFVGLPEEDALARFSEEYQVVQGRRTESPRLVARANTELPWYMRHSRFFLAAAAILLVVSYLIAEVIHLVRPPTLEVYQPVADMSTVSESLTVYGRADPAAEVRINNQQTDVGKDGGFSDTVNLQPGLNELKITATRKYSQTAVVIRRVLLEQKK